MSFGPVSAMSHVQQPHYINASHFFTYFVNYKQLGILHRFTPQSHRKLCSAAGIALQRSWLRHSRCTQQMRTDSFDGWKAQFWQSYVPRRTHMGPCILSDFMQRNLKQCQVDLHRKVLRIHRFLSSNSFTETKLLSGPDSASNKT